MGGVCKLIAVVLLNGICGVALLGWMLMALDQVPHPQRTPSGHPDQEDD